MWTITGIDSKEETNVHRNEKRQYFGNFGNIGNGNRNAGGYMFNGMSGFGRYGGGFGSFSGIGNGNVNEGGTMTNGIQFKKRDLFSQESGAENANSNGVIKKMEQRQTLENIGNDNQNQGGEMTNGLVNSKFGANGGFGMSNIGNGNSNLGAGKMSNGIVGTDFSGLTGMTGMTGMTVADIGINNFNGKVNPNNNGQKNIQMPLDNFAPKNTNTGGNSYGSGLNGQPMSNFNPSQTMQVQTNPNGQDFTSIDYIDQQIRELNEKKKLRMQQQNQNQNNQLWQQKKAQIAQLMKELAQYEQPNNNGYSQ